MDQTLKSLVLILEEGKPELKIAATQVLGELAPKEPAVARALAERLQAEEHFLTPFVLEALANLGNKDAIDALVEGLQVGGASVDRVCHLLGVMEGPVSKTLVPLLQVDEPELQARVLGILGRRADKDALTVLNKALLDPDPNLSARAADVLQEKLEELDEDQAGVVRTALEKALTAKSVDSLPPETMAEALAVLAKVSGEKSRTTLLRFAGTKQPPVVRQAALRSLRGVPLTPAQAATILGFAVEQDMTHVARPAMHLLDGLTKWNAAGVDALTGMLDSDSEERQLFALRALRERHTEDMAKTCLRFLMDGNPAFQAAAGEALGENPAALKLLFKSLQTERNVDRARLVAQPLAELGDRLDRDHIKSLVEKTAKLVTAGEPMGDVYLNVIVEGTPDAGVSELVEKAVRLRRARKAEDAIMVLVRLAQGEHLDDEGQYQLGVARLMMDSQDGRPMERPEAGDATMGYFAGLIRRGYPVLERLKKEGQLTPENLLRVGRHFADGVAQERRLGGQLLQFVATKHSRQPVGEEARLMLRSEGLEI
ncbi:MAG: hypothetical protein AAF628_26630 [Planctomycetota bacterium]